MVFFSHCARSFAAYSTSSAMSSVVRMHQMLSHPHQVSNGWARRGADRKMPPRACDRTDGSANEPPYSSSAGFPRGRMPVPQSAGITGPSTAHKSLSQKKNAH
jgi:hypothetical protein